ncbi:SDR family NAD(P)-dependent oxidoreductase [Oceanicella actignis]|uniref:SDR family NAD(P)-dependent oxidoreductase n=1 Tax=Oceanicella actignis TaxID=1189325 RepID=UPI0011E6D72D|nr:SDR family oxidoreductase [Oceanicella actignis]TYO88464.1 NAD(P)-dependent dehydrogenase (short-subunit alcohol dehydrogenase family) [Oceanicella actignis]
MFDISGKVAVITGSSRGIGKATAMQMARSGAKVVISSRKAGPCEAVAEEIRAAGGEAIAIPCHVGEKAQIEELVEKTLAHWGRIDILVCNAATNPVYGPISALSDDAFHKIMTVNVLSTIWLTNLVLPQMAANGGGAVVLLSSIAALRGNAVIGCYGMSKAAEASLARNLAVEWGPKGVRVNAVAPGLVATDFAKALTDDPERRRQSEEKNPLRRIGVPDDIAGVVHFLCSPAAAYITGQVIVADGGETVC